MSIANAVITDAHQHFWTKDVIAGLFEKLGVPLDSVEGIVRDFEPADLKPWLDKLGISQTVVVQVNSTLENTRYFLERADRNDWIGGVVGWVDLADPAIGETLDQLRHPKLVGFRHQWHDEADPAWNVRPDVLRGLKELARRGLALRPAGQAARMEIHPSGGRGGSGSAIGHRSHRQTEHRSPAV